MLYNLDRGSSKSIFSLLIFTVIFAPYPIKKEMCWKSSVSDNVPHRLEMKQTLDI